ncbi:2Fe-2S iron-sulfur cluster-binding protein [Sphingomonadaceae bacterium G21617-S1]|nr:2Fe-2S iron-sulfur cluster-binding protein [Sphingomonadaceae bacterium G21617-S1]
MPNIKYVTPDGTALELEAIDNETVMATARRNGIAGIDGECGGEMTCCTCHVIVAPEWFAKVGGPGPEEAELLEMVPAPTPTSRLSCQLHIHEGVDGLIVRIPDSQI